jgi:hypothetical protein
VIVESILDGVEFDITDPADLDHLIPDVYVNALVRPHRRKDIPGIVRTAPDGIALHIAEDEKAYVPVTYRNGIAYITIDRAMQYSIRRTDFEHLEEFHYVKIRVGNRRYQGIEAAFESYEELRNAPGRLRRQKRREEAEAIEVNPNTLENETTIRHLRRNRREMPGMAPKTPVPTKHNHPKILRKFRQPKTKESPAASV